MNASRKFTLFLSVICATGFLYALSPESFLSSSPGKVEKRLDPLKVAEGIDSGMENQRKNMISAVNYFNRVILPAPFLTWENLVVLFEFIRGDDHNPVYFEQNYREERLRDNFSIGIGGHINPIDRSEDIIQDGMKREFLEEVDYPHDFDYKIIGYINDDVNSVGRVHFGIVFLIDAENPDIKVRETDILKGELKTLEEIGEIKDKLENWSKIVFDYLSSG